MFKKIFEYAGPYKKNMYVATVVVLVSVLMGVLPFVLAYQVISPLVMGDSVETEFVLLRLIGYFHFILPLQMQVSCLYKRSEHHQILPDALPSCLEFHVVQESHLLSHWEYM